MIRRLAYRNMKRFAGDYQIYMITLVVVAALLYAFDSLFWDKELGRFDQMNQMMMIMVGLATGFVVIITAWLIYYRNEKRTGCPCLYPGESDAGRYRIFCGICPGSVFSADLMFCD